MQQRWHFFVHYVSHLNCCKIKLCSKTFLDTVHKIDRFYENVLVGPYEIQCLEVCAFRNTAERNSLQIAYFSVA